MLEKQYFSSQIITSAIMFLTNGNPGLGFQVESCPAPNSNGTGNLPPKQPRKWPSLHSHLQRISGTEANGSLNTFHLNGLQQNRLHICNHSFFNLILVSNTFSGPNTSTRCHHLIGRYSMPGLKTSDSMCWVFTWIWNESVNLHFIKGMLFVKQSRQIFHEEKWESCSWKAWWSVSPRMDTACPWDDPEAFWINWNDFLCLIPWGLNWASESNIDQTLNWFLKQEFSIWRWELYSHWGAKDTQFGPVFVWLHSITWIQMKCETSWWCLIFSCVGNYYNSSDLSFKTTAKYNNQIVKNAHYATEKAFR